MEKKLHQSKFFELQPLAPNLEGFLQKYNFKEDTMNESDLQTSYNHKNYPRHRKITTDERFVNFDKGKLVGTHWVAFDKNYNKSQYFDNFDGTPDKFFLSQIPKPRIYH